MAHRRRPFSFSYNFIHTPTTKDTRHTHNLATRRGHTKKKGNTVSIGYIVGGALLVVVCLLVLFALFHVKESSERHDRYPSEREQETILVANDDAPRFPGTTIVGGMNSIPGLSPERDAFFKQLTGMQVDAAVSLAKQNFPALKVVKVPHGSIVTMDVRMDRLRIWYKNVDGQDVVVGRPRIA